MFKAITYTICSDKLCMHFELFIPRIKDYFKATHQNKNRLKTENVQVTSANPDVET